MEQPASQADIPNRQELGIILDWYSKRVLNDRLTRKTRKQQILDQLLQEEFNSNPRNRS